MPSAFIALWTKSGSAWPDDLVERMERALPFHPSHVDRRSCGTATLWSFRLDEQLTGAAQWSSEASGAAALTGYGIDPRGRRLTAADLLDPEGLEVAWRRFHGEWSACAIEPGRLVAGSSAIGTEHVYRVDTKRFGAVASRARLLWEVMRAFGEPLTPDFDTLGMLLSLGHPFCTSGTAVQGVMLVEPQSRVELDTASGACSVTRRGGPSFFLPEDSERELDWDALAQSAVHNLTWLASTTAPVIAAITGGKDSRLVLSMLGRAGVLDRVDRFSIGAPAEHADAIVAREIADRFGLQFERTDRNAQPDLVEALTRHVGFTEGLLGAWDLAASTSYSPRVHVHGLLGEIYRGRPPSASREPEGIAGEILSNAADFAGLLRPEVKREQKRRIADWLRALGDQGVDLAHARDAFYLHQRVPRWVGQARLRAGLEGSQFNPLFSLPLLRAFWALPSPDRRGERVHFEIMARCWPELLGMPFAEARWDPGMVQRSSRPGTKIAPARAHARPIVGTGWQVPALKAQFPVIAARIEGHSSRLESIVARARVHELLRVVEVVLGLTSSPVHWARAALRSPVLLARARRSPQSAIVQVLALLTIVELVEATARERPVEVRVGLGKRG